MNDWWRSWHGAPTDGKWLAVAKRAGVAPILVSATAWALFDYASQHQDRGSIAGFDIESYAIWAGAEESDVTATIQAMTDKQIIRDGRLTAWEKRQPQREDHSTARVRAFRQRRNDDDSGETPCNAEEPQRNASATRRNAPEEIREDTEKIQRETPARARARQRIHEFQISDENMDRIFENFPALSDDRIAVEADACRSYWSERKPPKSPYRALLNWLKKLDSPLLEAVAKPDESGSSARDRDVMSVRYFNRAAYDEYERQEEAHGRELRALEDAYWVEKANRVPAISNITMSPNGS